ncbi:hypothetical protein R3W88_024403 [Solanum pinnatisectum]|uniref:Reverse transcriptase zinc-binding domain-containing protein n=1 Tax=Solanum pinnatisectum TaxID=50273 RepID=A0AAV9M391_9SOLN|nr:hypothetical protein R3W88_024403 [Solanum pinnatisectum]
MIREDLSPIRGSSGSGLLRHQIGSKPSYWLLYHWRLPTNHSLHHTGLNVNPKCQYSDNSKEDITHIFLQCPNSLFFRSNILSTSHNPGITNTISTNEIDGIEQWDNMKY